MAYLVSAELSLLTSFHIYTYTNSTYRKTRSAYATKTIKQWTIYYSTAQRLVHKQTFENSN